MSAFTTPVIHAVSLAGVTRGVLVVSEKINDASVRSKNKLTEIK